MDGKLVERLGSAIAAARAAGDLLRAEFHRPGGPRGTPDHADADIEAETMIDRRLHAAWPADGYRGEELGARRPPDPATGYLWVVDPNDGTSAFMKGCRGAAVSIALLRRGQPVLGVVFAYNHPDDRGDLFAWAEGSPVTRNGDPAAPRPPDPGADGGIVLLSHHADRNALANSRLVFPHRYRALPSVAHRLAMAAAGEGDAAVSVNSPTTWDLAGGHALLRGAGADLYTGEGAPVRYTEAGGYLGASYVFGGSRAMAEALRHGDWHQALERTRPEPGDLPFPCPPRAGEQPADPAVLARAQGCLLGQLAGDALGSLVEFRPPEAIAAAYPHGVRDLADGGCWDTLAGQPTDDSELALALARTLVRTGAWDAGQVRKAYVGWLDSGPFDVGNTTRTGLRGVPNLSSQANGALMRVSPLGIFGAYSTPDEVSAWAREDAALTHPHPVCAQGSALFAMAIARAVRHGTTPDELYGQALSWAREMTAETTLMDTLRGAATAPPTDTMTNMGWVLVALRNAFWQLLHAPSLEEALVDTMARGGDTDTNGAICGALLGAVYGREAIPRRWRNRLLSCRPVAGRRGIQRPRPSRFWPADALVLAERLLQGPGNPESGAG